MVPPEEGTDRFIDKEDKETPLPILPSGNCGINVTEAEITTLYRDGVLADENNDPAPDNDMQSDDVLSTPSSLTFGFHGVYHWRQSGKFPVERAKLKMTPIPRIHHISCLNFFMKLYFMEYIKDLFIPDNKKCLNSSINLSEFLCVIGCCLVIACYVGHSIRDLFLNDPITPHKGTPIRLNHIIYGRFLDNITQVMSYTNIAIPEFNDTFLQHRQMQEG